MKRRIFLGGLGGALTSASRVASAQQPSDVTILGRTYRLHDPTASNGKWGDRWDQLKNDNGRLRGVLHRKVCGGLGSLDLTFNGVKLVAGAKGVLQPDASWHDETECNFVLVVGKVGDKKGVSKQQIRIEAMKFHGPSARIRFLNGRVEFQYRSEADKVLNLERGEDLPTRPVFVRAMPRSGDDATLTVISTGDADSFLLGPGALQLQAVLPCKNKTYPVENALFDLEATSFVPRADVESLKLIFAAKADVDLPLHPRLDDRPGATRVQSALMLRTRRLGVIVRWDANKPIEQDQELPPPLGLGTFVPARQAAASARLLTYACSRESSAPLELLPASGVELSLLQRYGSLKEAGGLLLAPGSYRVSSASTQSFHVKASEMSWREPRRAREPRVALREGVAPQAIAYAVEVAEAQGAGNKKADERESVPLLRLKGPAKSLVVQFQRPGDDYAVADAVDRGASYLDGTCQELLLPLLPLALYPEKTQADVARKVDESLGRVDLFAREASHASRFIHELRTSAAAAAVRLKSLLSKATAGPEQDASSGAYRLNPHRTGFNWGMLKLGVQADENPAPKAPRSLLMDHYGVADSDELFKDTSPLLRMTRDLFIGIGAVKQALKLVVADPVRRFDLPRIIVKLDTDRSLDAVLGNRKGTAWLKGELERNHPHLLAPQWVGILFISPKVSLDGYSQLSSFVPRQGPGVDKDAFANGEGKVADREMLLDYLALSPTKEGDDASISASLYIPAKKDEAASVAAAPDKHEVTFAVQKVELIWTHSELIRADIRCTLTWHGLFGQSFKNSREVRLASVLDEREGLKFVAQLDEEVALLSTKPSFGPIAQVYISSAQVTTTRASPGQWENRAGVSGRFEWQELKIPDLGNESLFGKLKSPTRFEGLGFKLPARGSRIGDWLEITYPSIKLDLNMPIFECGPLRWHIEGMDLLASGAVPKNKAVEIHESKYAWKEWQNSDPFVFVFRMGISIGKLPELAIGGLDGVKISFGLGLWPDDQKQWSAKTVRFWMESLEAAGLKLDLLRFLTVTCKRVVLRLQTPQSKRQELYLNELSIGILDTPIIEGLSLAVVGDADNTGVLLAYAKNEPNWAQSKPQQKAEGKGLSIDWLLISRGFAPPRNEQLYRDLIALPASPGLGAASGQMEVDTTLTNNADANKRIRKSISGYLKELENGQNTERFTTKNAPWTFGAGFRWHGSDSNPLFVGRFLFVDRRVYGLAVSGDLFKAWFGYDLSISVLYIKRDMPGRDSFSVTTNLPSLILTGFSFIGGQVSCEIFTNSDFCWDFGFPHKHANNARMWERTLGLIGTVYQGSGGFYLRKQTARTGTTGTKRLLLAGGLAIQGGLGAASQAQGGFKVIATIGFFAVAEGLFLFDGAKNNLAAFDLEGACGILLRGSGELDWWVISIRVEVCLMAECATRLRYGRGREYLENISDDRWANKEFPTESDGDVLLTVRCTVTAQIAASACIGPRFFRVCKGVTVSMAITVQQSMKLA